MYLHRSTVGLVVLLGLATALGCASPAPSTLPVVDVAAEVAASGTYTIDLQAPDHVYFLAGGTDARGLAVACPSGTVMGFASYLANRVLPSAPSYRPHQDALILGNGDVPEAALAAKTVLRALGRSAADSTDVPTDENMCTCRDDATGAEWCRCDDTALEVR
mgnify:CR=1 FL=1